MSAANDRHLHICLVSASYTISLPAWPPQCLKIPLFPSKATTHPSCQLSAAPLPGKPPRSSLGLYHTPPSPLALHLAHYQILWFFPWSGGAAGPSWVWLDADDWERGSQAGQLLTCQCLVTVPHANTPVWLVAMSCLQRRTRLPQAPPGGRLLQRVRSGSPDPLQWEKWGGRENSEGQRIQFSLRVFTD